MNNIEEAVWSQHASRVVMWRYGYAAFLHIRAAIEVRTKHTSLARKV